MTPRSPALIALWALSCTDSSGGAAPPLVDRGRSAHGRVGSAANGGGPHAGGAPGGGGIAIDAGGRDAADAAGGAGGGSGGAAGLDGAPDVVHPDNGPGAIVAYDIGNTDRKLYVLDPETGRPLSSESIGTVHALVNDGASYPTDRWYVFEQTSTVDAGVTIHVRRLDPEAGSFREIGALANAPGVFSRPVTFGADGKSFVAYLSEVSSPKAGLALTVVDATDPATPTIVPTSGSLPSGAKFGLVADGDALAVVTVQAAPCPIGPSGGQECKVSLARASVTRSAVSVELAATVVDSTGPDGNVDFAMDPLRHEGVIGVAPIATPSNPACGPVSRSTGTVRTYSMRTATVGPSVSIPMEAPRLSGAAFDTCGRVAFFTALADDPAIWAVPVAAGGVASKRCVGTAGGSLFYEPSSRSLFRVSATSAIEAYRVGATGSSTAFTPRSLSELPAGLRVGAMAVRNPSDPACPPP